MPSRDPSDLGLFICFFSLHIDQRSRWSLTRQAHACELGRPTYQSHNKEQPPAERSVISGRADGREDHGHDLGKGQEPGHVSAQEKPAHTAKLAPLATKTTELTALVPLPQGKTHLPEALASRHDEPGPRTGS